MRELEPGCAWHAVDVADEAIWTERLEREELEELDGALRDRIRRVIRENTTPRHVPAKIVEVPEIPRTKSGKIVEIAVRSVVHGEEVKNTEALANPEALQHFRDIPELSTA